MLITIITICLNSEKTLEKTLKSIVEQPISNLEYIIIDGGSTDSTLLIIKSFQEKYSFIKYFSEKDKGISDAFNKGINNSNGDIIGIVNSDDWLEKNILIDIQDNFYNGDILHGNLQYWRGLVKDYLFIPNLDNIKNEMSINHPTVFVKKELYQTFGLFKLNYRYAMDYELLLRFYLKNASFYYINKTISNMSLDGVSDRNWHEALLESRRAKIENGINRFDTEFFLIFQFFRTYTSRILIKYGFITIISFYRKYISRMKKHYDA